jgi:sulfotransferase
MVKQVFFQSSLPRSGSTLFQNLMCQNPDFYATPTSGFLELLYGARHNFTESPEFKAQDPKLMKNAFYGYCKEGMFGYFNALTEKSYVLDKSRGHLAHYNFIDGFYSKPKIITLVRNLEDIIASMEKKHRQNQHKSDSIINHSNLTGITTPKRVDIWLKSPPIGLALDRLSEAIRQGVSDKILLIKYESLCLYPEIEMKRVYDFLSLPYYTHNFNNIEQITKEDDSVYGYDNLHTIKNKLELSKSDAISILGEDVCIWLRNNYKWYYDFFSYS